ncbi:RcnB family protein [Silvibacterium acidisoli]|uniref:RcnB family protein n=1 Tax=Acidobacteriaceae bacterium ZG23-2 TaxID=2883246 RepID=UPI00406CC54F
MNKFCKVIALTTMSTMLSAGVALADDHHDDHHGGPHPYVRHDDWHRGGHIPPADWNRGERIDYHHYHLSAPPHGYEWREVDGNYVLASIAGGIIASTIIASTVH